MIDKPFSEVRYLAFSKKPKHIFLKPRKWSLNCDIWTLGSQLGISLGSKVGEFCIRITLKPVLHSQ